jgi:hypothetical protein
MAILLVAAAAPAARSVQPQNQFYQCPSGYSFSVHGNGSAARCVDVTPAQTANYYCAAGQVKIVDQSGTTDACMNTFNNAIAVYSCPTNYNRIRRSGPDICEKPAVTSIKPVDVAVIL